jgi:manganese/zinc/iron transport system permease protein
MIARVMESLEGFVPALDGWIIAIAVLSGVACALIGPFLMLRRLSMMGDAISHAVLPGLAIAFILTQSRSSWPMFAGAALTGLLTAVLTEWVRGFGKVDEGASMGVVFTTLFAVGLVLMVRAADAVDLDPSCVLYGAIELTPLDLVGFAGFEVPRVLLTLAGVCLVNLVCIVCFYKELKIAAFDPALATALGIRAGWMHYMLMTLVAVTAVACFESVGNILVVAMLIVPAATAYLLTDRLSTMIVLSVILAAAAGAMGHMGAIVIPAAIGVGSVNTAGMIATMAGLFLAIAVLLGPRHGLLARLRSRPMTKKVPLD